MCLVSVLLAADGLMKELGRATPGRAAPARARWAPIALVLAAGPVYGALMGSFALTHADRLWMVLYAAVKVPLLLFAASAVCLPGFFVLNTVLGLRDDFRRALGAVLAGQAALSVALASLGPLTRLAYFSGTTHRQALLFNAAMFTLATAAGQWVMLRRYRPLLVRSARHHVMLWSWVVMYAFVGMQMGWMLRPFVGNPNLEVAFFRDEPFSNAYVVIVDLLLKTRW
jgi:hypothetical protein